MFSGNVGISRVKERFSIQIFGAFIPTAVMKATRGGTKALEADGIKCPQSFHRMETIACVLVLFHQSVARRRRIAGPPTRGRLNRLYTTLFYEPRNAGSIELHS